LFNRPRHRLVAAILDSLDAGVLVAHRCYFGGGTAIVLRRNEYRESLDVDFLVSDIDGYRGLRELVTDSGGINALARRPLHPLREVRADQYGLRTLIDVEGSPVKLEIIHEGRIVLDAPSADDHVCGVWTLSTLDMAASKLLANADRWADPGVFHRDLIDLAMLEPSPEILRAAIGKASRAYGDSIEHCLDAAIDLLGDKPERLDQSIAALRIDTPKDILWQKIQHLRPPP
jgi:hypothetical protein